MKPGLGWQAIDKPAEAILIRYHASPHSLTLLKMLGRDTTWQLEVLEYVWADT